MSITLHNSGDEKPTDKLQLLLVGTEKSGKSELAATAPDPVLFLEHDRRAASLAGKKGVYAIAFTDPTSTTQQPTAFNETLETLTKLEASLDLAKLGFKVPAGTLVKTIVIDSIATFANTAKRYSLYANSSLAHTVNVGGQQYRTPHSWTAWGTEMEMVEAAVLRAAALPVNIIVTLHEANEEAEDSTEDAPKYTGHITVFPVRYRILLKYFNEVWRLTRASAGPPTISFNPDGAFLRASSALRIDGQQPPNIKDILRKVAEGPSVWRPTVAAKPTAVIAPPTAQPTQPTAQPSPTNAGASVTGIPTQLRPHPALTIR